MECIFILMRSGDKHKTLIMKMNEDFSRVEFPKADNRMRIQLM